MIFPNLNGSIAERSDNSYTNRSEKFTRSNQEFKKQYAHIYSSRLQKLTELLKEKASEKWGKDVKILKLAELKEDEPKRCIIIGTFFKHQELKPSILKEISEENQLAPAPSRSHYADDSDILILEDDIQRIRLIGKIDVGKMVTGVVSAVLGYEEGDGRFAVEDYIFYECGPERPLRTIRTNPLVVFVSGLDLSQEEQISSSLDLFQQWIYGNLNMNQENENEVSHVVRLVIAGNSIDSAIQKQVKKASSSIAKTKDTSEMLASIKILDNLISNLAVSVNVDLMPGEYDASNYMLPQQPMHQCMFPESIKKKTFQSVTNPYQCEIEERLILGTAGQNVLDIERFSQIEDPLEALKCTLIWSHIAPTCPDTLPCYPYYNEDPFIITECPNVYFAGNCQEFKTELFEMPNKQKVRLIAIPSFSETKSVAVLNLNTLECKSLNFDMEDLLSDVEE